MTLRLAAALASLAIIAVPRSGRAQNSIHTDDGRAEALKISEEAAKLYKAENYAAALEKFEEAYRVFPASSLLSNLSHTEFKLNRCDDAVEHARLYAASQPPASEVGIAAENWFATMKTACPEIEVVTTPAGATLTIKGAPEVSRVTPWKERLPPGAYPIELRHEGYEPKQDTLNVSPGSPVQLTLTLLPKPVPEMVAVPVHEGVAEKTAEKRPESEPIDLHAVPHEEPAVSKVPEATKSMPATHAAGWSLVAAGGAGILAGAIVGITVLTATDALKHTSVSRTTASSDRAINDINSSATVTIVLLGAGAAVAVVGAGLIVAF